MSYVTNGPISKSASPNLRVDVDLGGFSFNLEQGIFIADPIEVVAYESPYSELIESRRGSVRTVNLPS